MHQGLPCVAGGDPRSLPSSAGGLAHNQLFRQTLADVLQEEIIVHPATNGPAIGAATYGAAAAGVFPGGMAEAVAAMGRGGIGGGVCIQPDRSAKALYNDAFDRCDAMWR